MEPTQKLIYDRTPADVQRVSELDKKFRLGTATTAEAEEYLSGMKGAYNATDFNRVGVVIEYIAKRLKNAGYSFGLTVKKDWRASDVPTVENTAYYLEAVNTLRRWFVVYNNTPDTPSDLSGLTYVEANNIEKILFDIDELITKMIRQQYYAGEVYAGEV